MWAKYFKRIDDDPVVQSSHLFLALVYYSPPALPVWPLNFLFVSCDLDLFGPRNFRLVRGNIIGVTQGNERRRAWQFRKWHVDLGCHPERVRML